MWIHGYLHLLGHDHKKNKDYYLMNKRENLIFKKLNKIKINKGLHQYVFGDHAGIMLVTPEDPSTNLTFLLLFFIFLKIFLSH